MRITDEMLERTAALAKLPLPEEDRERTKRELEQMLALVERSCGGTTEACPDGEYFLTIESLREDVVTNENGKEAAMENAAKTTADGFLVPMTIAGS